MVRRIPIRIRSLPVRLAIGLVFASGLALGSASMPPLARAAEPSQTLDGPPRLADGNPQFAFDIRVFPAGFHTEKALTAASPLVAVSLQVPWDEIPEGTQEVEIAIVLSDGDRQIGGDRWTLPLGDPPIGADDQTPSPAVHVQTWIEASPGELTAEISVTARPGEVRSRVRESFEMVDLAKTPIALSTLWLEAPDAPTTLPGDADPTSADRRRFDPTELVAPGWPFIDEVGPRDHHAVHGSINLSPKAVAGTAEDDLRRVDLSWKLTQNGRTLSEGQAPLDPTTASAFALVPDWSLLAYGPAVFEVQVGWGKHRISRELRIQGGTRCLRADKNPEAARYLLALLAGKDRAESIMDSDDPQGTWAAFWEERDPTPGTTENEFWEVVHERIETADARYTEAVFDRANVRVHERVPGWMTDRGRVFVRFGPPDIVDTRTLDIDARPAPASNSNFETWTYAKSSRSFIFIDYLDNGRFELYTGDLKKSEPEGGTGS